ncbi:DUF3564 family protein [Burkholderia glumae]|uniref:DUF3564 family protein n=1 Tax=Burkholderia glumae TaxID=337 RepID=UPI0002FF5C87|nr:DUF3564 family protein [Burkholderia glumae]MCR1768667.1 DUF3564 family protein [Burkholderia glumae]PJO21862.1 DUF3564 domain-containing protein [Burkholderia glumae AU6208]QHE13609.1 DUF3564 family protein [Burkholderia glumae AU6208]QHP93039.1 DUF3564 family protein [Burkholderia glumae]QKM50614.1 hypothetical protein B7760_04679 [Burkholderia glumae]
MRLTIRINGTSQTARQPPYAVLWVDTDEQLWSREAHQGIDLPCWGKVKHVEGAVALCAADGDEALCRLQGLSIERASAASRADGHGTAVLGSGTPSGAWRLQAVDRCATTPETQGFTIVER